MINMRRIEMLCQLKKYIPTNYAYFFIFIIFKFQGAILLSISVQRKEDFYYHTISFNTFFHVFSEDLVYLNYDIICLIIYIILIIFIVVIVKVFLSTRKKKEKTSMNGMKSYFTKQRFIPFLSILLSCLAFASQYIIEILSFPLCCILVNNMNQATFEPLMYDKFIKLQSTLRLNVYGDLVINGLFIILLNCFLLFYMKILNNLSLSKKKPILIASNHTCIILLLFPQNMHMFHYYKLLFAPETKCAIILNLISMAYFLFAFFISFYLIAEMEFGTLLVFSLYLFCIFGSFISLLNNLTVSLININNIQIILQILLQVLLTIIAVFILYQMKKASLYSNMPSALFKYNKIEKFGFLVQYLVMIKINKNKISLLSDFVYFLMKHQEMCGNAECDCASLKINKLKMMFKGIKTDVLQQTDEELDKFKRIYCIIENNIMNYINNLYISNKLRLCLNVILLHVNFTYYIKHDIAYSLYLIEDYIAKVNNLGFEYMIYLLIIKQEIVEDYYKNKIESITNNNNKDYDGTYLKKCEDFLRYYKCIQTIKNNLTSACGFYLQILNLKEVFAEYKQKSNAMTGMSKSYNNHEMLFDICWKFNNNIKKIKTHLLKTYKDLENASLNNEEMCYLLTHFFLSINKTIPEDIAHTFNYIEAYEELQKSTGYFSQIKFTNPAIISIKNRLNDNESSTRFYFEYISQKILDKLHYNKEELINQDMHILLPEIFWEQHLEIIQTQIFVKRKISVSKKNFVITKEHYYQRMKTSVGCLPTLLNHILFICDFQFLECNDSMNMFLFVIDQHGNIITFTENFTQKYHLTYNMLNKLKISFCSLFSISMDKVYNELGEKMRKIEQIKSNNIQNYMSLLSYSKLKDVFKVYFDQSHHFNQNQHKIKDTCQFSKTRKDIKGAFGLIRKDVEDREIDSEWSTYLRELENHFSIATPQSDIKEYFTLRFKLKNMLKVPYFTVIVNDYNPNPLSIIPQSQMFNLENHFKDIHLDFMKQVKDNDSFIKKTGTSKSPLTNASMFKSVSIRPDTSTNILNSQHILIPPKVRFISLNKIPLSFYQPNNPSDHNKKSKSKFNSIFRSMTTIRDRSIKGYGVMISIMDDIKHRLMQIVSLGIIGLFIYILIFKSIRYDMLESQCSFNTNMILFKAVYYEIIAYYISICFRIDKIEDNPQFGVDVSDDELYTKLYYSTNDLLNYLNTIVQFLNQNYDLEEGQKMFEYFYDGIPINKMIYNWSSQIVSSTFENEVHLLHYKMASLMQIPGEKCRMKEMFFNASFEYAPDLTSEPNEKEVLFFYLIKNGLRTITERIDEIIVTSNRLQRTFRQETFDVFLKQQIGMIALVTIEVFIFILIVYSLQKKISKLLNIFLSGSSQVKQMEHKITLFIAILKSFDEPKVIEYENSLLQSIAGTMQTQINSTINDTSMMMHNQTNNSITKKMLKTTNGNKTKTTETPKDLDKSSLDNIKQEEEIKVNIKIKLITVSYITVLLLFIAYIALSISILFKDLENNTNLKLSNEMGKIYLSIIPRFNEIALSLRYNFMFNDTNDITLDPASYDKYDYTKSTFFTYAINIENDSRYTVLGISKLRYLFKKFYEDMNIVRQYSQNTKFKILPKTRKFHGNSNCEYLAQEYVKTLSLIKEDATEFFLKIIKENCKAIGGGIMEEGMSINLEKTVDVQFNLIIDFKKGKKQELELYLRNTDFELGLSQLQNVYVFRAHVLGQSIIEDMHDFFLSLDQMKVLETSLLAFIIICIIIVFLMILLPKISIFFTNFKAIVHQIEISLLDDKTPIVPI